MRMPLVLCGALLTGATQVASNVKIDLGAQSESAQKLHNSLMATLRADSRAVAKHDEEREQTAEELEAEAERVSAEVDGILSELQRLAEEGGIDETQLKDILASLDPDSMEAEALGATDEGAPHDEL